MFLGSLFLVAGGLGLTTASWNYLDDEMAASYDRRSLEYDTLIRRDWTKSLTQDQQNTVKQYIQQNKALPDNLAAAGRAYVKEKQQKSEDNEKKKDAAIKKEFDDYNKKAKQQDADFKKQQANSGKKGKRSLDYEDDDDLLYYFYARDALAEDYDWE